MKRSLLATPLLLLLVLAGCTRGTSGATPTPPTDFGLPPVASPTIDPLMVPEGEVEGGNPGFPDLTATQTPDPLLPVPTVDPNTVVLPPTPASLGTGRFTELRFATSGSGQGQANFPAGTQEIYAIWNYDGMKDGDQMQRVWYLNDQVYVDRNEAFDFLKYGFNGTVRDVFLFDKIDGIDPGNWRVELYLNGEKQIEASFTVGGP